MKYRFSFFAVAGLACAASLLSGARDAHACTTGSDSPVLLPPIDSSLPIDGPLSVRAVTIGSGALTAHVTNEDGAPIDVVSVTSPDPAFRWFRPVSGDFPEGRLTVVLRVDGTDFAEAGVRASGKLADYRVRVDSPELDSEIWEDDQSPKIRCGRGGGEDSCGPVTDDDLPSRWRRAPIMSFSERDAGWARTLFIPMHRWSVRLEDGTVLQETDHLPDATRHGFATVGVEYCVEVTRTPRAGVAASTQTERLCIADDGSRFAWSDADNQAQLVETSKDWGCKTLDFPPGVDVPAELEEEASAGEGGCSIGVRPARSSTGVATYGLLFLAALATATKRRQRYAAR